MMIYLIFIFFCFLTCFSSPLFAQSGDQQRNIDSLTAIVNSGVHDTIRLINLNRLARLFYTTEPDKGMDCARKALELCRKLQTGQTASSGPTGNKFLAAQWAYSHQSMAVCPYIKGEHPAALDYFFKTITLFEQLLKSSPGNKEFTIDLARTYANAGNIFGREKNNEKALEFFFKSLSLFDQVGSPGSDMANTYINIGNIYKDMSRGGNEGELISKAMDYYFKALKIAEKIKDKRRMASSYTNIGGLYALIRNSPLAIENFEKALGFHREAGNKWGVAYTLLSIGQEYLMVRKPEQAREALEQAAALANEMGAKKEKAQINEMLAYADTAMAGKNPSASSRWWQNAFHHYYTFKHLNDSIINEENLKSLAKAEAKFDYDKKLAVQTAEREKERLISEVESRRKNIVMLATVVILLLTAVFAAYIFTRFKIISRQKNIIQQQNQVLEDANKEISFQKQVIQEKNKDITDSIQYASRIQRAILPKDEIFRAMFPDSFIFYKPRDIVSGDFYWVACPPSNPPVGGRSDFAYMTAEPSLYHLLKERSIEFKKNPTSAENHLWNFLRKSQLDVKFNRQHIIGRFIVDFVALEKKMVVEVDGDIHDYQKEEDERRTNYLMERGFKVIRFRNEEIFSSIDTVMATILSGLQEFSPPPTGEVGRGAVLLCTADCTGHGVPGALMSMIANDQLTHIIGEKKYSTAAEILEELDLRIRKILHTDESGDVKDGLDIAVCFFDVNQNLINYSGANNPLWIIRNNDLTEYRADRTGIGGIRNASIRFMDHFIPLEKDDQIYLFTDGFSDQFGGASSGGKKFSRKNFRNLILSMNGKPMVEQKEFVERIFNEWKGSGEQTDDVTVIGIRI